VPPSDPAPAAPPPAKLASFHQVPGPSCTAPHAPAAPRPNCGPNPPSSN
jgi:hypothetical protein